MEGVGGIGGRRKQRKQCYCREGRGLEGLGDEVRAEEREGLEGISRMGARVRRRQRKECYCV